jgi:hypothetical protein
MSWQDPIIIVGAVIVAAWVLYVVIKKRSGQ